VLGSVEKSRGCKNGMDILYHQAVFGGYLPLQGGVRKKSGGFVLFVTFWVLNLNK